MTTLRAKMVHVQPSPWRAETYVDGKPIAVEVLPGGTLPDCLRLLAAALVALGLDPGCWVRVKVIAHPCRNLVQLKHLGIIT